ncbi:MAG TPA: phosphoribosylformylglycinamidine synthase subunit PurQ [Bacteroidetes bacterium]|nr:phosphoribosylformylglycinamidine synthase subunit PurQ [Bacteroidota bacterium]
MKFGVVVFPGSNCDHDMVHVLRNVMKQEVVELWHKETELPGFDIGDCIVLPGGFSYGDYLRAGAIARFSPLMNAVIEFAKTGGYVLGICNGFQVLCEAGLLPGVLLRNDRQKFVCKNVHLSPMTRKTALTAKVLDLEIPLEIPIAHADGRYYADEKTLDALEANQQVLFKYCSESGNISAEANPNGSMRNIAGICNTERNVFGMMPHPERAAEEALGNTDGRVLFESLIETASMAMAV